MTMSWAAFAVAAAASLRMEQSVAAQTQHLLRGAATLLSVIPAIWVRDLPL